VDKILEPIKSSWPSSDVSIVSDGWTDVARHPLINFTVSSLNGLVFLKVVDALGKYKDAQYMGELFIKVIEDVGVDSCVQIIIHRYCTCLQGRFYKLWKLNIHKYFGHLALFIL